jgi:hypothetical protein
MKKGSADTVFRILLLLLSILVVQGGEHHWTTNSGTWDNNSSNYSNWLSSTPPASAQNEEYYIESPGAGTITLGANYTLGYLSFDASDDVGIGFTDTYTLTFDSSSGTSNMVFTAGSYEYGINSKVALSNDLNVTNYNSVMAYLGWDLSGTADINILQGDFGLLGYMENYTGTISIDSDASLTLSYDMLTDNTSITLEGGTLTLPDDDEEVWDLDNLTLTDTSIIDMTDNTADLSFYGDTDLSTHTLKVYNYDGVSTGGGDDQLFLYSLTNGDVGQIEFYSDGGSTLIGTGSSIDGTTKEVLWEAPTTWTTNTIGTIQETAHTGDYTWSGSDSPGSYVWEAYNADKDDSDRALGTDYDSLSFTGKLTIDALSTADPFDLELKLLSGGHYDWTPNWSDGFKIIEADGGIEFRNTLDQIVTFSDSYFAISDNEFGNTPWYIQWELYQDGNSLWLRYKTTPEPATWVMLFGCLCFPFYRLIIYLYNKCQK